MHMRRRTTTGLGAAGLFLVALLPPSAISAQGGQEQTDTSTSLIEIRLARQAPAPEFQRLTVPRSGQVVYVGDENVITDGDFELVRALATPDGLVLTARWKPGSAERMAEIQRGEAGAGNDFLAVFIDGELVNAPRIRIDPEAAATPSLHVAVPVLAEAAERIAEAVAERWPGG